MMSKAIKYYHLFFLSLNSHLADVRTTLSSLLDVSTALHKVTAMVSKILDFHIITDFIAKIESKIFGSAVEFSFGIEEEF